MRVHLFGHPVLVAGDRTVKPAHRRPKVMPLLGYLVLHRDRPISRRRLAFTLWPDDPEEAALANLRRHLHDLLRSLPPAHNDRALLLLDARTVQWNDSADAWCDVAAYEDLTAAGRLAEAVDVQSAGLLDDCDDEWLVPHRARLHDLQVASLRRLVAAHCERREYEPAIAYAKRIIDVEPWNEDVMRELIELRCANGSRAAAITEYRQFAARLRRELGVGPMPLTGAALGLENIDSP